MTAIMTSSKMIERCVAGSREDLAMRRKLKLHPTTKAHVYKLLSWSSGELDKLYDADGLHFAPAGFKVLLPTRHWEDGRKDESQVLCFRRFVKAVKVEYCN